MPHAKPHQRLFVALDLSHEAKDELAWAQSKLRALKFIDANFPRSSSLHLTLKFLGNVNNEDVAKVISALQNVNFEPMEVKLGGLGHFPKSGHHIKIIWASLEGEGLAQLQGRIEDALDGMFEKEDRDLWHT